MQLFPGDIIIRRGLWLYDGTVPAKLILVRAAKLEASGDEEDPPEIRDGRDVEGFRVWFESPPGSGEFRAATRQYPSEREAMDDLARSLPASVQWE